jgi:flagellar hook-associated protein 3
VASGSRVIRASDDPDDAFRIMTLTDESRSLGMYQKNIGAVTLNLEEASNGLQEVSTALTRANQLLAQASTGTYREENRLAMAEEVNSLLEQVVSLANYKSLGRYVFSGTSVGTAPYKVIREGDRIARIEYQGSRNELPVPVAPGVEMSGVLVGDEVFRNHDRQPPTFFGDTGAAAGSATSTVRGDVWLTVSHTATSFDDGGAGTGISAGTSTAQDTVLGAHALTVDADNKTIRLDDGEAVAYDGSETDLRLTNADGDAVHVDLTDPALLGLAGTINVDVEGTGRMSIDDGASTVALNAWEDNVAVSHAETGKILYVNTSAIRREGTEPVRVRGTYDVFNQLIEMRDLMANQRELSEGEQTDRLVETTETLKEVMSNIHTSMTRVGSRLGGLETLGQTMENVQANANDEIAGLANADVAQLASDLARTQTLYEMTLAASSKLLGLSLMNYIR